LWQSYTWQPVGALTFDDYPTNFSEKVKNEELLTGLFKFHLYSLQYCSFNFTKGFRRPGNPRRVTIRNVQSLMEHKIKTCPGKRYALQEPTTRRKSVISEMADNIFNL